MPERPERLVADIGGTRARFAIAAPDGTLGEVAVLANRDHASLAEAALSYLRARGTAPREACLAVAAPVTGDAVRLVNHDWAFSQRELAARLGLERLRVINDFEAVALALPALGEAELEPLGGGEADPAAPRVALGPGTGLGVAVCVPAGEAWHVLATEGGHASIGARSPGEHALLGELLARGEPASRETLLSGAGLERIHRLLDPRAGLDAAAIVARALEGGDASCGAALSHFCAFLGTAAGDQALCCGARGGVYIAGGIVPRFVPFLRESLFRHRFDERGPMSAYARAIPAFVVTHPQPGLLGAAIAPL